MTTQTKRRDGNLFGLALSALLTLCLTAGCSYEAQGSYRATGSTTSSGGVEFTAGGVDASSARPDFIFGTTRGAGARELSYVIAVNQSDPAPRTYSASSNGSSSFTGGVFTSSHLVNLDGFSVRVEHTANVDPATGAVSDERLLVQGAPVDLSKGRLILLGDGAAAEGWVQISDPLPSAPREMGRLADFVATTVTNLAQSNGVIEAFLQR